jgi:hypothetical protein
MAELLKVNFHVHMDDMEKIIDDLGKIQKYKMFDGDEEVYVNVDDVIKVLRKHLVVNNTPETGVDKDDK